MILIVSGPGGVGKGTIVARLLQLEPDLWLSRSWTTRSRRPGESTDAYEFVSRDRFVERVNAGGFVEWTDFPGTGHLYGTPTFEAPEGRDVLLEIELDGAQQVKRLHPEAALVLVVAPSPEVQKRRLRERGDDPASIANRLRVGVDEERTGRQIADYVVVNDDVDRAAAEVQAILHRLRGAP